MRGIRNTLMQWIKALCPVGHTEKGIVKFFVTDDPAILDKLEEIFQDFCQRHTLCQMYRS